MFLYMYIHEISLIKRCVPLSTRSVANSFLLTTRVAVETCPSPGPAHAFTAAHGSTLQHTAPRRTRMQVSCACVTLQTCSLVRVGETDTAPESAVYLEVECIHTQKEHSKNKGIYEYADLAVIREHGAKRL